MSESVKIWWRKIGGGSLRHNGKIIKPNEKFQASPDEIPTAFLRYVVPLEPLPEDVPLGSGIDAVGTVTGSETKMETSPSTESTAPGAKKGISRKRKPSSSGTPQRSANYEARKREESEEWEVVNISSGKPINDAGLTKSKALQLVKELDE